MNKIKKIEELIKIIQVLRKEGKKIATLSGSFDILHPGHIQILQEAKNQADILIVLLNSDRSVRGYKGKRHPINNQEDRAAMLSAIQFVDYIVIFDDLVPNRMLEKIKPDVHCNGSDWGKDCVEKETVEKNGGRIHVLKWKKGYSSTKLVQKILQASSEPEAKAIFLDRDGTINENGAGYIHKIEDFQFKPKAEEALRKLSETDYKIIILSNQSGIGRGYFSEQDLEKFHKQMLAIMKEKGIRIDGFYYCPHHPSDNCSCRKPKLGLIKKAVQDFNVNLSKSWMIGNEEKDILTGKRANTKTFLVSEKSNLLEAVKNILSS